MSAWGSTPRFGYGAVKNANIAKTIFPEWIVRVFIDDSLPQVYANQLYQLDNVEVCEVDDKNMFGAFWRFLSFSEEDAIVLSRDSDSRLTSREKKYVDEWINSEKTFSIIRDHPRHYDWPMLAGMWGARSPLDEELLDSMNQYYSQHFYTIDQIWLKEKIWPIAMNDCFIHGHLENENVKNSWNNLKNPYNFIGQGWGSNDLPLYGYSEDAIIKDSNLFDYKFQDVLN